MSAISIPAQPVKQRKSMKGKLIGAIALLVVAAIVAVGSGANFTAHTANPGNMVTEGSFSISNDKNGLATFAPQTNFDPGDAIQGDVTIGNSGSESGNFTVKMTNEGDGSPENLAYLDKLFVQVFEYDSAARTGSPITVANGGFQFSGSLKQLIQGTCVPGGTTKNPDDPAQPCTTNPWTGNAYNLNSWSPGQTHYYRFNVSSRAYGNGGSLNGNDPSVAQYFNQTGKFGVEWDAVSSA